MRIKTKAALQECIERTVLENKVYVFAGNHEQYRNFCREYRLGPTDAMYVSSDLRTYGLPIGLTVFLVGSYYKHQEYHAITRGLTSRRANYVDVSVIEERDWITHEYYPS